MTARKHIFFWALAFVAFIAIIYVFKAVLLPFVLGATIAYLLNPLVHKLGKAKITRGPAALLIVTVFFLIIALLLAILAPLFYKQAMQLADDIPRYFDSFMAFIDPYSQKILRIMGEDESADIKALLKEQSGTATTIAKNILGGIAAGGQAVLSTFTTMLIAPIVAYFMMKEWDAITQKTQDLMPRDHKATIMDLLQKIDVKISGFVRGQISVALILGIAYSIALSIAGLNYGFLIGLSAGLLSIIPMVGSTVGLLTSIAVAWFQSGEWSYVAIIAGIFLIGQLIEGNILSPKIVGDSVGLHPLWIFFALMAGGSLFGILGMLLAVPIAAVIGVLLNFAINKYKASPYYEESEKTVTHFE